MKWIILFLLIPTLLFSQTYYIDYTTGNDENNGLTTSTAWKNVDSVLNYNTTKSKWSVIGAGDSILLKRGEIWNPSVVGSSALIYPPLGKQGAEGDSIYIGAYGAGARPILSKAASGATSVIAFLGTKYFIVEDLEIRGKIQFSTNSSYQSTGYSRLTNLLINCSGVAATNGAISHANSILSDELANEVWTNYWAEHIDIGQCSVINTPTTAIKFWLGRYIKIHHNYIFTGSGPGAGVDFGEGNCDTIEYNYIISPGGHGIKMQAQRYTIDSLVIRGNIIKASTIYASPLVLYQSRYSQIYNNTFIGNTTNTGTGYYYGLGVGWVGSQPIYFSGQGTWGVDSCLFENNIIYGGILLNINLNTGLVYHYPIVTFPDTIRFTWTADSLMKRNTWKNNIIFKGSGNTLRVRTRTWHSAVYEHYWNTATLGACLFSTCTNTSHPAPYYQWTANLSTPWASLITTANFETAWNGAYSTIADNLSVDPALSNINGINFEDFIPLRGSPCDSAGIIIADWKEDILGRPVNPTILPTIGAFYIGDTTYIPPFEGLTKKLILKPY